MAIDQPTIVYHHDKDKGGKKGKKGKDDFRKANPLNVLKAQDRWDAIYGGQDELKPIPININLKKDDVANNKN